MKFSIRDLFLVTMIVALALGWWMEHRAQVRSRENAERGARILGLRLVQDGYRIGWDGAQSIPVVLGPGEFELPHPQPTAPNPPKR